jgi:hypothetical protein
MVDHVYECVSEEPSEWGYVFRFKCSNGHGPEKNAPLTVIVDTPTAFTVGKSYALQLAPWPWLEEAAAN